MSFVSPLAVEAEGYNEKLEDEERIQNVIGDHVSNLERLRHCIVQGQLEHYNLSVQLLATEAATKVLSLYTDKKAARNLVGRKDAK